MKFEFKNKNKFKIGSEKGNHLFFKSAYQRVAQLLEHLVCTRANNFFFVGIYHACALIIGVIGPTCLHWVCSRNTLKN